MKLYMMGKPLKQLTWQEFVANDVLQINTWPYLPSGILKQHDQKLDLSKETETIMEFYRRELADINRFVELFSEKQKAVMGWIFAAWVGVLGNLAVNLGFGVPIILNNLQLMLLALVLMLLSFLIAIYLRYLPKVSITFIFIPRYDDFPTGYEQYINQNSCTKFHSNMILQLGQLRDLVTDFGSLVRIAILKECLKSCQEKLSYVRISSVRKIEDFLPVTFIEISTNGIKPWLDFKGKDKIKMELNELINAMLNARQRCSVRKFELDPNEWRIHGCDFLDGVSDWNFKEMRDAIIQSLYSNR
ncbi:MAG: hypothetical protein QXR89_05060 [Candidatus Bathyarchaeia archaeon]